MKQIHVNINLQCVINEMEVRDELTKSRIEGIYGSSNAGDIKTASDVLKGIHGAEPAAGDVVSPDKFIIREASKRVGEVDALVQWL